MRTSGYFSHIFGRITALLLVLAPVLPSLALADLNEEQKLAPTINIGADAGQSSAIFGDTAVVGAPGDPVCGTPVTNPTPGAAYVFTRVGSIWTNVATLCASDGVSGDQFGAAVSISNGSSGNLNIAVGAPGRGSNAGAVYVYSGSGASWTENGAILTASGTTGLGSAVSIQGFTIAAGAPHTQGGRGANVGITVVFTSNDAGGTWTHTTFRANGGQARTGGLFGTAVSLSGSTILVGAPGYHTGSKQNSGNVFVFVNSGSVWTQQANIRPANVANVFTGTGVSLFQNTAAFGAPGASNGKGTVYVYTRTGTSWSNTATVTAAGGANGDNFGSSVSIEGTPFAFLAAGAPHANSGAGTAYEFGSSGGSFSLLNQLIATDNAAGDNFGTSIGLDAGRIVVGAPFNGSTAGAAYIFKFRNPSITAIKGFSTDPDPSLTGVPYTVTVWVSDNSGGTGTPTGTVLIDDSNGGTCNALLAASGDADGHAVGSCILTSNFFGSLTMNASWGGDPNFAPSSDSVQHLVTGNHFVFNPVPPPNVLQGDQVSGVVVELHNGADALIASDSTTQVTLSVDDVCGNTDTIATQTLAAGVTTFTGVGPRFYAAPTTGGAMGIHAAPVIVGPSAANSSIDIIFNAEYIFADGFDDCTP